MSILYLNEHTQCPNYLSEVSVGFKYMEVKKGGMLTAENKKDKHLFFFLKGSAKVGYNEFEAKIFKAGEMIFLPNSADCKGEAITDCTFILLVYEAPIKICDRDWINAISCKSKDIEYKFDSLSIYPELMQYLNLLKTYLIDGVNCKHLHEMKMRELFLLLKGYYKKEMLAQLFFPIMGKSMDFRSKVMTSYLEVKTVKEFATTLGYSERRFSDLFFIEFEETPYKWMQKQKSKHILGKLAQKNIPIKDIVYEFHFTCQSHFNKYCIKLYGETPVQIRKKIENRTFYLP